MRAFRPRHEHPALQDISAERIADICQVHVTTARRWKRGEEPPYAAIQLVQLAATGNLGIIDPAWNGWKLKGGVLAAHGYEFTAGDVMSITWLRAQIVNYQSELRLPRQADWVSERWGQAQEHYEVSAG